MCCKKHEVNKQMFNELAEERVSNKCKYFHDYILVFNKCKQMEDK